MLCLTRKTGQRLLLHTSDGPITIIVKDNSDDRSWLRLSIVALPMVRCAPSGEVRIRRGRTGKRVLKTSDGPVVLVYNGQRFGGANIAIDAPKSIRIMRDDAKSRGECR